MKIRKQNRKSKIEKAKIEMIEIDRQERNA